MWLGFQTNGFCVHLRRFGPTPPLHLRSRGLSMAALRGTLPSARAFFTSLVLLCLCFGVILFEFVFFGEERRCHVYRAETFEEMDRRMRVASSFTHSWRCLDGLWALWRRSRARATRETSSWRWPTRISVGRVLRGDATVETCGGATAWTGTTSTFPLHLFPLRRQLRLLGDRALEWKCADVATTLPVCVLLSGK